MEIGLCFLAYIRIYILQGRPVRSIESGRCIQAQKVYYNGFWSLR